MSLFAPIARLEPSMPYPGSSGSQLAKAMSMCALEDASLPMESTQEPLPSQLSQPWMRSNLASAVAPKRLALDLSSQLSQDLI
jgi:hypothetical protein